MREATESPPSLHFNLPFFAGDISELVRLVSMRRVLPTDVPVAEVMSQYRARLRPGSDLNLEEVGEFLAASSRLMVVKSAFLLVQPVAEEDEIGATESAHRGADRELYAAVAARLAEREGLESFAPIGVPQLVNKAVEPRSANILARVWVDMGARAEGVVAAVAVPAFVRLETAVSGLLRRLRVGARVSLRGLLRGASRQDAVVHFLAVLEVVRTRQAAVSQGAPFTDITVEYAGDGADAASRAG